MTVHGAPSPGTVVSRKTDPVFFLAQATFIIENIAKFLYNILNYLSVLSKVTKAMTFPAYGIRSSERFHVVYKSDAFYRPDAAGILSD